MRKSRKLQTKFAQMLIEFSPDAERDLADINDYLHSLNPAAAIAYCDEITEFCKVILANNPKIGVANPELLSGVRTFPIRNHLILYDIHPNRIVIIRIIHGARDLTALE